MEVIGRNLKEEVMKVLERIDERIELEEVRRLGRRRRAGEEMLVAKMKTIEQKARVMKEKGKLAGQKERLEDDLMGGEKDSMEDWEGITKWQGRRIRIGYGKAWIDGKLWVWDEKDRLKDESGNEWKDGIGEIER